MNDKECPAEPVVDDDGTPAQGGFQKVADHLNALYPTRTRPISRQLVHKWWMFRHFNAFPEARDSNGTANGGKGRPLFDIAAVEAWHASYLQHRGAGTASPKREQRLTAGEPPADGEKLAA